MNREKLNAMIQTAKGKSARVGAGLAATTAAIVSGPAMASGGTDFSSILDGLSGTTAVTAVLGAAAILALVGFAVWGGKKVAKFFG